MENYQPNTNIQGISIQEGKKQPEEKPQAQIQVEQDINPDYRFVQLQQPINDRSNIDPVYECTNDKMDKNQPETKIQVKTVPLQNGLIQLVLNLPKDTVGMNSDNLQPNHQLKPIIIKPNDKPNHKKQNPPVPEQDPQTPSKYPKMWGKMLNKVLKCGCNKIAIAIIALVGGVFISSFFMEKVAEDELIRTKNQLMAVKKEKENLAESNIGYRLLLSYDQQKIKRILNRGYGQDVASVSNGGKMRYDISDNIAYWRSKNVLLSNTSNLKGESDFISCYRADCKIAMEFNKTFEINTVQIRLYDTLKTDTGPSQNIQNIIINKSPKTLEVMGRYASGYLAYYQTLAPGAAFKVNSHTNFAWILMSRGKPVWAKKLLKSGNITITSQSLGDSNWKISSQNYSFTVQGSTDAKTWTTLGTKENAKGWQTVKFAPTKVKYLRVVNNGGNKPSKMLDLVTVKAFYHNTL